MPWDRKEKTPNETKDQGQLNEGTPGGHQFTEKGVTFTGDRFKEVVKKLRLFRINNGIPEGYPDQDILIRYAEKWPYLVEEDTTMVFFSPKDDSPIFRWKKWVMNLWKNPPKSLISAKEAKPRWEICKDCKFNLELSISPRGEDAGMERRSFLLRRGQDVPDYLNFCSLHGMPLDVGCLLENPAQFSTANGEKYDKCWVKSPDQPKGTHVV